MKKVYPFILITILIVVSGCATSGGRRSSGADMPRTLEVANVLKFQDVPTPNGFKMIPSESFVFDNDITRLGIIKYSGSQQ